MAGYTVGQIVSLPDNRRAIIRFIGKTHFAPEEWIGIELEEPTGKNDGAIQGERYFDCEQNYGMFIRPKAVAAILEQPKEEDSKPGPTPAQRPVDIRGRASSTTAAVGIKARRTSVVSTNAAKRQSSNTSSPSPIPKSTVPSRTLRSPTKSPVKQLSERSITAPRTTSVSKPPLPSAKARSSVSNRASIPPLTSATTTLKSQRQPAITTPNRISRLGLQPRPGPATTRRTSPKLGGVASDSSGSPASELNDASVRINSSYLQPQDGSPHSTGVSRASLSPTAPRQVTPNNGSTVKELEDLKAKYHLLEKKRAEDREKMKGLETIQAEKEKYEGIIQKLQAKYQPQQQEIVHLRKQLKEAESRVGEIERLQAENDSILEMATLDREMAEEVSEAVKAEYEALKIKAEELELEVDILREENQELGQVTGPEERSSQGWLQMERTNERLKEALIRLRDMTQQQEADLKSQIKELEEDLEGYNTLKAKFERTMEQLVTTEANMEELKQQIEALGAEEMIEELSEKNMHYQEQIGELKATIEDLESLKELSDELEATHLETERQLQEEIDYRDGVYLEQNRKLAHQDEVIEDLEYTLSKFRELVTNLQSDLEDMRASQQISETEASDLSVRSRAMIDLNLKLQASAAKAQVKAIDIELGRMEAEESAQHLAIIKEYLPAYFDTERNPVLALLNFKRISSKALIMGNTVREKLAEPSASTSLDPDSFLSYDLIEKLTWISFLCDRFVRFMHSCSSEEFTTFEGALYELDPVERILNSSIDSLKKAELNEKKCIEELQRSISLLSHLAETLIPANTASHADDVYMRCALAQTYMDHTASCLSHMSSILQVNSFIKEENDEWPVLFQKIDSLTTQTRSLKVATGKITRSLDDLRSSSLSLSDTSAEIFGKIEQVGKRISEIARRTGESTLLLITEEGRLEPVSYREIVISMSKTVSSIYQLSATQADATNALAVLENEVRTFGACIEDASSVSCDLSQTIEFERHPAPWTFRSKELKSNQTVSADTEEEVRRLKTELSKASTSLGLKDRTFEEQSIKIELLESRMREAGKKATLVKEMESKLELSHSKESELLDIMDRQSKNIQTVEKERDEYRNKLEKLKRASGSDGSTAGAGGIVPGNATASLAVMRENDALREEVANLQAAVRFLRDDNRRAHLLDPYSVQRTNHLKSWLDVPLLRLKASSQESHAHRLATSESQDVFTYLIKLSKESKFVDLGYTLPPDSLSRFAWRPLKTTSRYAAIKQREHYEQWNQWKDDVIFDAAIHSRRQSKKPNPILERRARRVPSLDQTRMQQSLSSHDSKVPLAFQAVSGTEQTESLKNPPAYGLSGSVEIVES
ncbi:hypothetical protein LOZ58_002481 [Ophidiomyces ophidiicola]|nr:hypothetical protein LOZ58_002481 [Ophidiomyces ophidiicola]